MQSLFTYWIYLYYFYILYFVSKCLNCLTGYFILIGVHACMLSCVQLFVMLRTVARQAPLLKGFFRQEYWSGLLLLLLRDLTCISLHWQADSLPLSHLGNPLG